MKLILSRKGFDAGYGGVPSPIFPDLRMFSLPIPSSNEQTSFGDLRFGDMSVGKLVEQLTNGRITPSDSAHLDPDLNRDVIARDADWVPAFGQVHNAQSHLANQNVGRGDLFLFYGWFREVEIVNGRWRYKRGAPDMHVLYGWLKIGDVLNIGSDTAAATAKYPGLATHPHCYGNDHYTNNTVYVGSDAGTFKRFGRQLVLTEPGETRSVWRLPRAFLPGGRTPMTYHGDVRRWTVDGDQFVRLRTVPKGQEFVLDLDEYPEVHEWVDGIFQPI